MDETPIVGSITFSNIANPNTWGLGGDSKALVFSCPSEAKRGEELFTAMQDAAFKAGREAGMREAAAQVNTRAMAKEIALQVRPYMPISAENVRLLMDDCFDACGLISNAILSAIGGGE